ncbi:MAG: EF-P beta-lysylation protein EpmB [Planctomycetota bacterium]
MKQETGGSLTIARLSGDRPHASAKVHRERPTWQRSLHNAIRSRNELLQFVGLPVDQAPETDFRVLVTREFAGRMRKQDPDDPLLKQVLPDAAESDHVEGFTSNPVGDDAARVAPGLLHKYAGRALIITTGACAVHCRYCFRRDYPYIETSDRSHKYRDAVEAVAADSSIDEVILSGGDPLTLTDHAMAKLVTKIESVDHVSRLRIHSRIPIVLPSRITQSLIHRLQRSRLSIWWVVHINHPAELDETTLKALSSLVKAGFPVLNQSVLLRGINDNVGILAELSTRLINAQVMPYYLHQLDRVHGAAHFEVAEDTGLALVAKLRERLPGYAVPQYVREIAGEASKTPIA